MADYRTYEMTPVIAHTQVYEMMPVEAYNQIYKMVPVGRGVVWTFLGTLYIDSKNWASLAQVPGNYVGYAGYVILNDEYERVRVVGASGAWNDGSAAPNWRGFCNVVTQVDYALVGVFSAFGTEAEAEEAFVGRSAELTLGKDKRVFFGIDDAAGLNSGVVGVEIYAR